MKENKNVKIALLAVLAVALLVFPIVDKNTYHQLAMAQTLVNIIIVLGLNFITGLTGQMNLGTAGIMALGAYSGQLMVQKLGMATILTIPVAILMGVLIGYALGYPSLRLKGVYLSLTTIGFSEIVRLVITNWADFTGGTTGVQNIKALNLFGLKLDATWKLTVFLVVVCGILVFTAYRIVGSKYGRVFKAIRDNIEAVEACGIDVASLKIKAFTLAAIFGCVGGCFYGFLMTYLNPTQFTQDLSANYLLMMMFGGIGSVPGSVIGATAVTLLPEVLRFTKEYYWLIFGIITLLFAIFLPYGFISLFQKEKREEAGIFKILNDRKGKRKVTASKSGGMK
ncbi:MAG: branched-chain amino acid ABC transporter permease [Lachnospiraceae bacterium]|nr:branched-chain amino acid ABC transporter permease [Lachnospiraceae bacterium]